MFVCLSSGSSARYREDILRALAMPVGSRLQFRYDQKWVAATAAGVFGVATGIFAAFALKKPV